MKQKIKLYANTFWQLLKTDLVLYNQKILSGIVDAFVLIVCAGVVTTYIYPHLGMTQYFGSFFTIGLVASICIFEIWTAAAGFISDLDGDMTITYYLILPVPSWLVFVRQAIGYAYRTTILTIFVVPVAKLVLWNKLDLSNFSLFKFIIIFFSINLFSGFFTLFMVSIVDSISQIGKIWRRALLPLWLFGGAEFPWRLIYKLLPAFAYVSLFNPLLYPMEGIRSAVFGSKDYLPFWYCFFMMWFFGILFGSIGIVRLRKRLDYV